MRAQELIKGALFRLLDVVVGQAITKSTKFQHILEHLKFTIHSLQQLCIEQSSLIGERELELNLRKEEIENLKRRVEEGVKLVATLPEFPKWEWNYCCCCCIIDNDHDTHHDIVVLDRSLERLLEKLKVQKARDVKEFLEASTKKDKLDGVIYRRLFKINKLLHQKAGGVILMEEATLLSGSNTETLQRRADTEFGMLFDAVKEVECRNIRTFKRHLGNLKFTLNYLKPFIEEIAQHNKVLDRPLEELKDFVTQLADGVKLVRKCSKLSLWTGYKKRSYNFKLNQLDAVLQRQLRILRERVAMHERELLVKARNLQMIETIERSVSIVVQNQTEIKGSCSAVPEPPSRRVGLNVVTMRRTGDVKKELVSASNAREAARVQTNLKIST